jgi:hypothetical protein
MWAQIFARVIWPRLRAVTELEDARPARFAQGIGFVLTALALLAFLVGVDAVGFGLTAVAVMGSVIRATTGVCLGCRIYSWGRRLREARS